MHIILGIHSSEKIGLRSTKCLSEMLPILLYFMGRKTPHSTFFFHFSYHPNLTFTPYECPGHKPMPSINVMLYNMKQGKICLGFLILNEI